jgi:hypothetical protein
MTSDVWSFLYQSGAAKSITSGVFLEWFIRQSAAFKAWQKRQDDGKTKT